MTRDEEIMRLINQMGAVARGFDGNLVVSACANLIAQVKVQSSYDTLEDAQESVDVVANAIKESIANNWKLHHLEIS